VPNSALNQYYQTKRALIAFNTVVDSAGPYLDVAWGLGGAGRTLRPDAITVANNVLVLGTGGKLVQGEAGANWTWSGNITSDASTSQPGIRSGEAGLERGSGGLLRPTAGSPVRGAAEGTFPNVTHDIDGQPRPQKPDAGCDQYSSAPIVNRPLTAGDVGPAWLKR
jgi:poly(beta-D-mannuronate) lyase